MFGVEVADIPLPSDIENILDAEASFILDNENSQQRVRDNHLLVLMPSHINDVAFTLNMLGVLAKQYFPGLESGYRRYETSVRSCLGCSAPLRSYWLLMTRHILYGSRNKDYDIQNEMVPRNYTLPNTLETATGMLIHYARHKVRLFDDSPWTYVCCMNEHVINGPKLASVGGFSTSGLFISSHDGSGAEHRGIACCRRMD